MFQIRKCSWGDKVRGVSERIHTFPLLADFTTIKLSLGRRIGPSSILVLALPLLRFLYHAANVQWMMEVRSQVNRPETGRI